MVNYSIIFENQANSNYGVKVIKEKHIHNISSNLDAIKKLVEVCNNSEVDYDHFECVLENFMEDYETF